MRRRCLASAAVVALACFGAPPPRGTAAATTDRALPASAPCAVCTFKGEGHAAEKVKASAEYAGQTYYFCSEACREEFLADPAAFVPHRLPRPAPSATLVNLDGESVPLADFKGRVVLLDFWATWCKPCVKLMPALEKLQRARTAAEFVVVGVSIDQTADPVRKFVAKKPVGYPLLLDLGAAPAWSAYGVKAIPATFLINRRAQIVREWRGRFEFGQVRAAVDSLLAAEPVGAAE